MQCIVATEKHIKKTLCGAPRGTNCACIYITFCMNNCIASGSIIRKIVSLPFSLVA